MDSRGHEISPAHFIIWPTLSLEQQWRPLFLAVCRITELCTSWPCACGPHLLDLSFFNVGYILYSFCVRSLPDASVVEKFFIPNWCLLLSFLSSAKVFLYPFHSLWQLLFSPICYHTSLASPLNLFSPSVSDHDHFYEATKNVRGFPDFPLARPFRSDPLSGGPSVWNAAQ